MTRAWSEPRKRSARLMSADGSASGPTRGAQVYHLADAFQRAAGVNALASRKATQRLRLGACKAKELLSTSDEARVRRAAVHCLRCVFVMCIRTVGRLTKAALAVAQVLLPNLAGGKDLDVTIQRGDFERLCDDLFDGCSALAERLLQWRPPSQHRGFVPWAAGP